MHTIDYHWLCCLQMILAVQRSLRTDWGNHIAQTRSVLLSRNSSRRRRRTEVWRAGRVLYPARLHDHTLGWYRILRGQDEAETEQWGCEDHRQPVIITQWVEVINRRDIAPLFLHQCLLYMINITIIKQTVTIKPLTPSTYIIMQCWIHDIV